MQNLVGSFKFLWAFNYDKMYLSGAFLLAKLKFRLAATLYEVKST
jgi:hypothetical protein